MSAQMARHQWAADRLWEGIVGPSDSHWRSGLYVLANTHLTSIEVDRPALANRMRTLALDAYNVPAKSLAERAATYGELLVTCAQCHASRFAKP